MIVEKRFEHDAQYPTAVLFVEGCIERAKSGQFFAAAFENVLREANVIVDWSRVDYIDSTGIDELVAICVTQASAGQHVVFSKAGFRVLEALEAIDQARLVRVFDTAGKGVAEVHEWGGPHKSNHNTRRQRDLTSWVPTAESDATLPTERPPDVKRVERVHAAPLGRPAKLEGFHEKRSLRVFLCHASNDKDRVRHISRQLAKNGADVWFDEDKLLPGHDWRLKIEKALRSVDAAVICLSAASVCKTGFVQREIAYVLEIAQEHPEGAIFVIPAKLEPCDVPERLRKYQWVDLTVAEGMTKLIAGLNQTALRIGATVLGR